MSEKTPRPELRSPKKISEKGGPESAYVGGDDRKCISGSLPKRSKANTEQQREYKRTKSAKRGKGAW